MPVRGSESHLLAQLGQRSTERAGRLKVVLRSILVRNRVSPPILAPLGLRRDECGDIHIVEPPAQVRVLPVQAEGEAGGQAPDETDAALSKLSYGPGRRPNHAPRSALTNESGDPVIQGTVSEATALPIST